MKTREQVIEFLLAAKPRLQKDYGVHSVGLFGSYARGDQKEGSDIDLLVDVDPSLGIRFVTLADELEAGLEQRVEVVSSRALRPKALTKISRDIVYV